MITVTVTQTAKEYYIQMTVSRLPRMITIILFLKLYRKAQKGSKNMYEHKDLYTIDFSEVEYYPEMHMIIRDSLGFPDYYGGNWDAF